MADFGVMPEHKTKKKKTPTVDVDAISRLPFQSAVCQPDQDRRSMKGILVIGSEQTEVGKSTLATNIAVMAANKGRRVCLYDTDLVHTVRDWAERRSSRADPELDHIDVIVPAPSVVNEEPGAMREDLDKLRAEYELIVVDVPNTLSFGTYRAFSLADRILVPVVHGTLNHTEKTLRYISDFRQRVPTSLVYNQVRDGDISSNESRLVKQYGVFFLKTQIAHRVAWRSTFDLGLSVCEGVGDQHDDKAIAELECLYCELEYRAPDTARQIYSKPRE